jgi:CBS domain-containing protein
VIPVKDVMKREVVTFAEDTSVQEVAETLAAKRITGAPVVGPDGYVTGIVSEVDVFSKRGETARDIMSPHVISVTEDTGIEEAARLLAGERIRRLPVMAQGRMVGIVSRSDVLEFFASSHWTCQACGHWERGLEPPESCSRCAASDFLLERSAPGP